MKLKSKFWKVGTSTKKYVQNYLDFINDIDIFQELKMEGTILKWGINCEHNFNSIATISQNLSCWGALGFILKTSKNSYIKIVKKMSDIEIIHYTRYAILTPIQDEQIELYRHTIIMHMIAELGLDLFSNNRVCKQKQHNNKGNLTLEEVKKCSSNFEKDLLSDDVYKNIIKLIGEENAR